MSASVLRKNRALSHPRFESYRLAASEEPETQLAFEIPAAHKPRSPFDALPGLDAGRYHAHIFDRFLTAHLAPGFPFEGAAQAAYIDHNRVVVLVRIEPQEKDGYRVRFDPIFSLGEPQTSSGIPQQAPSILALDPTRWLVADGCGQVSRLTVSNDEQGRPVAEAQSALAQDPSSSSARPFKLLAARSDSFLAQTISRADVTVAAHTFARPLISVPKWTASTSEPLLFAAGAESGTVLIGNASLAFHMAVEDSTHEAGARTKTTEPTSSSSASVPTTGRLFAWYQTSDALTITFELPPTLSPTDFDIRFHNHHLSIKLDLPDEARIVELSPPSSALAAASAQRPTLTPALVLDRLSAGAIAHGEDGDGEDVGRKLWGDIDPTASFWTWERPVSPETPEAVGVLTLHLEKRHHGTRWSHVFALRRRGAIDDRDAVSFSAQEQNVPDKEHGQSEEDELEVPETLDPSERMTMLENLEKYTSDLGGDGSGPGHGSNLDFDLGRGGGGGGVSSLLEDGFEDEDANIGRDAFLLHVSGNSGASSEGPSRTKLLGLPLPVASADLGPSANPPALVVKDDIDGLVFVHDASEGTKAGWKHVTTLPALAYVLASKQDASHRVYAHIKADQTEHVEARPQKVQVLAFEGSPPSRVGSGSSRSAASSTGAGAGNLFVYYAPATSSGATNAESRVIRLGAGGAGPSGSLIAAAEVARPPRKTAHGADGNPLLLVLCQNQLLILPKLLL